MEDNPTPFVEYAKECLKRHVGAYREVRVEEYPMGTVLVVKAKGVMVELMDDRGDISFRLAADLETPDWLPIQFLMLLITGEKATRQNASVGKEPQWLDRFCVLFAAHAQQLGDLIGSERLAETKERVKELYGSVAHPTLSPFR